MSEVEFRLRELERRMGKVEDATSAVPVMQRDLASIAEDVSEVRDENRSMRRAFYSLALSIVSASVIALITVDKLFS